MTSRILMVGVGWVGADPGGLNRYVVEVHRALRDLPADVLTLVVAGSEEALPEGMRPIKDGRRISRLMKVWWSTQWVRERDVVVAHFASHGLLPIVFGRHAGKPLVIHFHGPWAAESRSMGEAPLVAGLKRQVELALYGRARRVITLSQEFADLVADEYGVDPRKVEVVAPGVDLQRFQPVSEDRRRALKAALGVPTDRPLIFTARRLVPRMGLHVLLQAWRLLPHEWGSLVVAGTGPLESALRHDAADLPGVHLLGQLSEEELVYGYQAADLVVVPSVELEGFGLIVLEALACGSPVVASRLGEMGRLLSRLGQGLVVPPGDAAALAQALRTAIEDGGPTRPACRALAEEYTWSATAERLAAIYSRAAGTDE